MIMLNKMWLLGLLISIAVFLSGCIDDEDTGKQGTSEISNITSNSTSMSDHKIKVAAFNLQIFDTRKAENPDVIGVLSKIIRKYDIIAVQGIQDPSKTALTLLNDSVNSMGSPKYDYINSESLGRNTSKEQYAYIYNTQTIQLLGSPYVYSDIDDIFLREPYVAEFKANNSNFDFVLITIHTDPDTATQEINGLPAVVFDAKKRFTGEGDFIIMGDLNADCSSFKENGQSTLRASEYYWIIDNSVDTTTRSADCTYDRIIITEPATTDLADESGIFYFDRAYYLNHNSTIAVSDHYPVFAAFFTNRDID